jgi:RNA polymerase sigma-B factor
VVNHPPLRRHQRRDALLLKHRLLVRPIALHYAQLSPEPVDDLMQVGLMGLLRAAESYDLGTGIPFESYARPHIRGAILHHLRDRAWLVRLPRRLAERQWSQWRSGHGIRQDADPAAALALQRWQAMNRPVALDSLETSADASMNDATDVLTGTLGLFNSLVGPAPSDGEGAYVPARLAMAWQPRSVEQMLAMVGPRQRQVLRHVVLQGWSYRRTATALQVSAPTVQRLLHRALSELQDRLSCDRAPSVARGC